jgi:ankyrin repeat protein
MHKEWKAAVETADLAAIDAQLASGADIDARDEHGQTALMNAARDGQVSVVRLLAERGADLNHHAKYGLSAVMLAVLRGHVEVVRVLVDAGADLTLAGTGAPGFYGKTAAALARDRGDEMVLNLLMGNERRER